MLCLLAAYRRGDLVEARRGSGATDQVAEERRVSAVAALVRREAGDLEQLADIVVAQFEVAGFDSGHTRGGVTRRDEPGVHAPDSATLRTMAHAAPYSIARIDVVRLPAGLTERDAVAVEEPLEIRIGGRAVAVTMRTPGHDEELALGFCLTEGLAPVRAFLPPDMPANVVEVEAPDADFGRVQRSFYTSSSCGVCGKGALEAVAVEAPRAASELRLPARLVAALPDRLREAQEAFAATGGLHAAGLFDERGEALCVREDVGRHNALDNAIGWAHTAGRLPLADLAVCVSGRLSFELVQKAAVAGSPVLVGVGAPSSLAVDLARDRGLTLCGFVRDGRINVYSETWRVEV